jgi:hypothetical protein
MSSADIRRGKTDEYSNNQEDGRRNPGRHYKALPGYAAVCQVQSRP